MFDFQVSDPVWLGALLTLILAVLHLARRIHQNSRAVRSCNRQACLAFASEVYGEIAGKPQLASLFRRGLNDFYALQPGERVQMHYFLQSVVTLFRDSYNAHNEGVISVDEYESNRAAARAVLRMEGGKTWWQDAQNAYPDAMREALNTEGDLTYALGDIYPYFIMHDDESPEEVSNTLTGFDQTQVAANDISCDKDQTNRPEPDWRRGLVRRRARQNFIAR